MKADEVLAAGIDVLLDQFGEDIEYRPDGSALWQAVRAIVEPESVSEVGNVLVNAIELTVSRIQVPTVIVSGDRFLIPAESTFAVPGEYLVSEILSESGTAFDLRCVRTN